MVVHFAHLGVCSAEDQRNPSTTQVEEEGWRGMCFVLSFKRIWVWVCLSWMRNEGCVFCCWMWFTEWGHRARERERGLREGDCELWRVKSDNERRKEREEKEVKEANDHWLMKYESVIMISKQQSKVPSGSYFRVVPGGLPFLFNSCWAELGTVDGIDVMDGWTCPACYRHNCLLALA